MGKNNRSERLYKNCIQLPDTRTFPYSGTMPGKSKNRAGQELGIFRE